MIFHRFADIQFPQIQNTAFYEFAGIRLTERGGTMIENLSGIHETVNYREYTQICLYNNNEDENYPPHWHNPFELIMPTSSTYRVKASGKEFFLREGDILIVCPGVIHELFAPPTGERIIFQPSYSAAATPELEVIISLINPAVLITPEEYPYIHERISQLMLEIKEEYFSSHPYSEMMIQSRFLEILVTVGRSHAETAQQTFSAKDNKQKEYLEKFLYVSNYINEHFAEDLTLEEVASMVGFSKYHFTRLFRQYADTSFYKYLNQKRIAHAKTLLFNPELSVIEVALQSGFSSQSAFLRMFKLINGCTPTEFRKMYD